MPKTELVKIIEVNPDKCVNCHACITSCPVKYCNDGTGEYVNVNQNMCIGCGKCIRACTHDARLFIDDFQKFLDDVLASEKIVAISAPSIAAGFPNQHLKLNTFLKEIGIDAVFDVSFGAELTVKSYLHEIEHGNMQTMISQPCAAVVTYIELYKPELLKYLAPVDSPMLHTMKMIKEFYPQYKNHKIAVLSPCNAKKREFAETGLGDYNIAHISIDKFIKENKVDLSQLDDTEFDNPSAERAVLFSNPGGLLKTAERWDPTIGQSSRKIEGVPLIYEYLDTLPESIEAGRSPLIIDCLSCEFGCNSGPLTLTKDKTIDEIEFYVNKRSDELKANYLKENKNNESLSLEKIDQTINKYWKEDLYKRTYVNRWQNVVLKYPNDVELKEIFKTMHKYLDQDIKNCSACGYGSCKGMAIAILNHLNRPENCHFYLQQETALSHEETKSSRQKLSNILETSLDGFVEINTSDVIIHSNDAFKNILKQNDIIGRSIFEFLDEPNSRVFRSFINQKHLQDSSFELEFNQSDKSKIVCLVSASELRLNGNVLGSFAMVSDISKLKEAEKQLRKSNETLEERVKIRTQELSEAMEELLQRNEEIFQQNEEIMAQRDALSASEERVKYILSSMPEATFVINKNSKVLYWNNAIEDLTGVKAAEILGKGDYEYALPFYAERKPILIDFIQNPNAELDSNYTNVKRSNGILQAEFTIDDFKGEKKYFIGRSVAIYDNDGEYAGAIEIINDITEKELIREKIEIQKKNITDSIYYARYIQDALLPPEKLFKEYLSDYFIFYKPRDIVSGDFYWIEKQQNKIIVATADCTGHGVSGAFMSILGVSFLNELVIKNQILEPDKILNEMRKNVKKALRQTEKGIRANDGMDMSIVVIDTETSVITYAGANNSVILVSNNQLTEYKANKMPIGIHLTDSEPFTQHTINAEKDAMLYMYSDGYVDQMSEESDRKFMKHRFLELLQDIHPLPLKEQKEQLEKRFMSWKGGHVQIDDVLVMGFKIK